MPNPDSANHELDHSALSQLTGEDLLHTVNTTSRLILHYMKRGLIKHATFQGRILTQLEDIVDSRWLKFCPHVHIWTDGSLYSVGMLPEFWVEFLAKTGIQ